MLSPLSSTFRFYQKKIIHLLEHYNFMNRNLASKHHQSELTAKQNTELFPEETGLYICVFPTKDTVKKYGIMLLALLL
jgi:hypothetical protein